MSIHPTAIIEAGADVADDCVVGPYAIVGAAATIGPGSSIDAFSIVGTAEPGTDPGPLVIGRGARIRSHTVIYAGSTIGDGLQTGHHATVRSGTVAGDHLSVGTQSVVEGSCVLGDFVRLHSQVFVAPDASIGSYAWLFPGVVLTNDPYPPSDVSRGVTIGDYAAIGARATLVAGVTIGTDTLVGSGSVVTRDVRNGAVVLGVPARDVGDAAAITDSAGTPAYPWRYHFHRGFPPEVVSRWLQEAAET